MSIRSMSRHLARILVFVFTACVALCNSARAQTVVHFADANLELAVRQAIGKLTGELTVVDLQPLTFLYAFDQNIRNLSGLEFATNLTNLYLYSNQIRSIQTLEHMPQLTALGIGDNRIRDLTPLRALTNLYMLSVGGNAVWDYSPLRSLTNLSLLDLDYACLFDISFLSSMP